MTQPTQSKEIKGLSTMSALDATVFDESCKDPCGHSSIFCGTWRDVKVRAANQSLKIVCDITLRPPGENIYSTDFLKDNKSFDALVQIALNRQWYFFNNFSLVLN